MGRVVKKKRLWQFRCVYELPSNLPSVVYSFIYLSVPDILFSLNLRESILNVNPSDYLFDDDLMILKHNLVFHYYIILIYFISNKKIASWKCNLFLTIPQRAGLFSSFNFFIFINFPLFYYVLSVSFEFSTFLCIRQAWWFDKLGPRNLLPPSRPSKVFAPLLNWYLPQFHAFSYQQGGREHVRKESEVSSESNISAQTAVF